MIHPGEMVVALGAFTAVVLSIKAIASAALRYQENNLKYSHSMGAGITDARIERMEHAIDAIAIEIERISENQRFTTKLLSDRPERLISRG